MARETGGAEAQRPRLYSDLAWLWPVLAPPDHYTLEAETLREAFSARRGAGTGAKPPRLLELGAGGGHILTHLSAFFECTALDAAPEMVELCQRQVPQARVVQGDMRSLDLGERFDLVLLLDAADYLRSAAEARRTLANAAAHLSPGGVLLLAPTYTRETLVDGETAEDHASTPSHDVSYLSFIHDAEPSDSEYELILAYLIRERATQRVSVVEDRHPCGVFAETDWLRWLSEADLAGERIEDDKAWTLFAAVASS